MARNSPVYGYDLQRQDDYNSELNPQDYLDAYEDVYFVPDGDYNYRVPAEFIDKYHPEGAWNYSLNDFKTDY